MRREDLSDLAAFAAIAEQRSFTRGATVLGVSRSALSRSLGGLEERLGVRLVHRTTRSLSLTEAGKRLLARLAPALGDIDGAVTDLDRYRDQPAGHVRISAHRTAATLVVAPKIGLLRTTHPDIIVDLVVDDQLIDIVAARFDAGIRSGAHVAKDMISVRVSPDQHTSVVASPAYLGRHPPPASPADLGRHACMAYRLASGGLLRWSFENNGRPVKVAVAPAFIANDVDLIVRAALDGVGLAYVLESQVAGHIDSGALEEVLVDWSVPYAGNHLYYPSRRQTSLALRAVIEALRH